MPLLRNNDANRSKLSKRRNPTSITWFRDAGFLPGALLNFLGLMVSSRAAGEEKFSLDQLVDGFRLEDISLGGPVFDLDKLRRAAGGVGTDDAADGDPNPNEAAGGNGDAEGNENDGSTGDAES